MSTRAEPEGAKAQRVDTDYVFGCRECWRLEGSLHAPTCRLAYGTGTRHAKEEGRRVHVDECRKFQAAVDPKPQEVQAMRPWIVFLQIKRDERRWEERANRCREAYLRLWYPAYRSRVTGPYVGQFMWHPNGHFLVVSGLQERPTDDEVYQDRWL